MNIYNLNNINKLGKKLEQLEQNLGDQTESGLQRSNFGKIAGTRLEQSWNKSRVCEAKNCKNTKDFNVLCGECEILEFSEICRLGSIFYIPNHWIIPENQESLDDLQEMAEVVTNIVRKRDHSLKVVLDGNKLICQSWMKTHVDESIPEWLR